MRDKLNLFATLLLNSLKNPLAGVKKNHGSVSADSLVEACSRLSYSGEDAKVKGARKVGGAGKRKG